jgi:hypothetical protein
MPTGYYHPGDDPNRFKYPPRFRVLSFSNIPVIPPNVIAQEFWYQEYNNKDFRQQLKNAPWSFDVLRDYEQGLNVNAYDYAQLLQLCQFISYGRLPGYLRYRGVFDL